jgi:hypothetical protein
VTEPVEVDGETENHSTPACLAELTDSPVSIAPHSVPFTHVTCCMRVSLLSRDADFSAKGSFTPSSATKHGFWFRHCRSGWVPDFCCAGGGRVSRHPGGRPDPDIVTALGSAVWAG